MEQCNIYVNYQCNRNVWSNACIGSRSNADENRNESIRFIFIQTLCELERERDGEGEGKREIKSERERGSKRLCVLVCLSIRYALPINITCRNVFLVNNVSISGENREKKLGNVSELFDFQYAVSPK